MVFRFVKESIRRAPRRKALIIAAIAMGSAVATAMLGVMLDIGDKVNNELRSVGANIVVTPRSAALTGGVGGLTTSVASASTFIPEDQVTTVKKIFWGLNVTGFSPSLIAQDGAIQVRGVWFDHPYQGPNGETQRTGVQKVNRTWKIVEGRWITLDELRAWVDDPAPELPFIPDGREGVREWFRRYG